jgi:hypothetical protein
VDVRGAAPAAEGTAFLISGKDKWSYNAPGQPRGVTLTRTTVATKSIEVPPLSVVLQTIPLR